MDRVESLDTTVAKQKAAKYDSGLETEVRTFLAQVCAQESEELAQRLSSEESLHTILKDGVLLCR